MTAITRRVSAPGPAAPVIGTLRRSLRVVQRNAMVYRHSWIVIVSGFFEPLFYLLGIGFGLGTFVPPVEVRPGFEIPYAAFVAGLPKAELHVHHVGSASPRIVSELAQRHPGTVPSDPDELREFYTFRDFGHFIEVYLAVVDLVREPEDVRLLTYEIAAEMAGQNIRYAELTCTPYTNVRAGVPIEAFVEAVEDAREAALHDHGVRVPEDVSVVGIDDIALSRRIRPRLTTVATPTAAAGRAAVDMLLSHGDDRRATAQVTLQTELVIRDSTGPGPA